MNKAARAALLTAKGIKPTNGKAAFQAGNHPDVPDVVYHGTQSDIGTFRQSKTGEFGPGIYLTDLPEEAADYAGTHPFAGNGPNVMPLHLSMKNPFVVKKDPQEFWQKFGGKWDEDAQKNAIAAGHDGVIFRRPYMKWDDNLKREVPTGKHHTHFVAFNPTQVKSALSARQFDPNDPDITKSGGGSITKGMDTKSENIADYVADLLRQGRASEVTDDLMAQADPQRLHQHYTSGNTGMDLPMDQASRMARAREMYESAAKRARDEEFASAVGLRTDTKPDGWTRPSRVWKEGFPTKKRINGVATTELSAYKNNDEAFSKHGLGKKPPIEEGYAFDPKRKFLSLMYGDTSEAGQDDLEAVIPDAKSMLTRDRTTARFDPRLDHLAHLSASTGGAMEFARHVEAVHRAGGQIAPSKYLPDVPRAVHADGGRIHANGGGTMDLRSKAAQVIRNQPQEKGNVDQMLAMMAARGVKPSELMNAGRPFGHSVSKVELAQHFENAVPKVQITKYGAKPLSDDEKREFHDLSLKNERTWGEARRFFDLRDKVNGNTQYSEHSLPGGENYREHLLHLPKGNREPFYSDHWQQPNVLAHLRMKDRDNGKTLHVEEVQSDWGQKGREKGFYDPQKPIEVFHTGTGQTVHATDDMGEAKAVAEKLGPQYDYGRQDEDKVPQGPYVGNTQHWTDLAIKHALTEAAKGGHDRVVFSPGEANADLYGQRTPISQATLVSPLTSETSDYLGHLYGKTKKNGSTFSGGNIKDEKDLIKALGKQHAKALLSQAPSSSWSPERSLSEPDMVLGGHGMVDYYNNIVHPAALKLLRQHDPSIQPESYDLPNGYKGFSLPMTDKARQSILENGFQAFKDGGDVEPHDVSAALALTRRFSKNGKAATLALKTKGK